MDSDKHIEELLQRYWLCETSVEEEAQLRAFFSQVDVPARWCRYKAWFAYTDECRGEGLGEDFDARVLSKVGVPVVKAKRVTMMSRFQPLLKAVAVVAVVVGLGDVVQRSFFADVEEVAVGDTIGRQISTPSVALSGEVPDVAAEKQKLDSLKGVEQPMEPFIQH